MYITKVLNNSLLLAKDDNDEEIILMGKGIGNFVQNRKCIRYQNTTSWNK